MEQSRRSTVASVAGAGLLASALLVAGLAFVSSGLRDVFNGKGAGLADLSDTNNGAVRKLKGR